MSRNIAFLTLLTIGFAVPAWGADSAKVDPALCRQLVKATPDANVAYQPGVDVHGNKVAPADVPSAQPQMPAKIQIPLTVNLAQAIHLDTATYPYNQLGAGTEGIIGTLTVEDNKAYFNGQPLGDAQQDSCRCYA